MNIFRAKFLDFLHKIGYYSDVSVSLFDRYYDEIVVENQKVNLFSRKMDFNEIWLRLFLDSVSVFEVFNDFSGKRVLDFGTGGGLPSLPIKILTPDMKLTLLDSTKKKLESVKSMVNRLGLIDVDYMWCRLESGEVKSFCGTFEVIVSRGVRITFGTSQALIRLLSKNGKILLYKSDNASDIHWFRDCVIHEMKIDELSDRKIFIISK